ncbi:MAG: gliding motility-associated C-terminal domain-containing protein [Bacteroidales bacterium]|jgi:gliding motility-associated-like protein|nr:gliding motility-associated C-terminal domain-containing protein [Bacteroidales bacterium]
MTKYYLLLKSFILCAILIFAAFDDAQAQSPIRLSKKVNSLISNGITVSVKMDYKIGNGPDTLMNLYLLDNIKSAFANVATVTRISTATLSTDSVYANPPIINPLNNGDVASLLTFANPATGFIKPNDTIRLTVTYAIRPNAKFPSYGVPGFTAYIQAFDLFGNQTEAESRNGNVPGGFQEIGSVTVIPIVVVAIEGQPNPSTDEYAMEELSYRITRKGQRSYQGSNIRATFAPVAVSGTFPATIAQGGAMPPGPTLPGYDAWTESLINNLNFAADATDSVRTLKVKIYDDNIYEIKETFTLELEPNTSYSAPNNNLVFLQKKITTTINMDEPVPAFELTDVNGQNKYLEGTADTNPYNAGTNIDNSHYGGPGTEVTVKATIKFPYYKAVNVPISIVATGGANAGTDLANALDFFVYTTAPSAGLPRSGTITFPAGATEAFFKFKIKMDDIEEDDEKFTVKANLASKELADIGRSTLAYTIRDDDKRQVIWMDSNTPPISPFSLGGLLNKPLHKGSEIRDTVDIDFYVVEGLYGTVKVQVTMPKGVALDAGSVINPTTNPKGATMRDFKLLTSPVSADPTGATTYEFVPVTGSELRTGDRVHFRFTRHATCNAVMGPVEDMVRIQYGTILTGNLYAKDILDKKGLVDKFYYSYKVAEGNLSMQVTKGDVLLFPTEADTVGKIQTIKFTNNGDGLITSANLKVELDFIQAIINRLMDNTDGTQGVRFTGSLGSVHVTPTQDIANRKWTIAITDAMLQLTGNGNKYLDNGEWFTVSYEVRPQSKKKLNGVVDCGLKEENIKYHWRCKSPVNSTGYKVSVELYRPSGKPALGYGTFTNPAVLYEDGLTENIYTFELINNGNAIAYNTRVPIFHNWEGSYRYKNENIDSVVVEVNNRRYSVVGASGHNGTPFLPNYSSSITVDFKYLQGNITAAGNYKFLVGPLPANPTELLYGEFIKVSEIATITIYTTRQPVKLYTPGQSNDQTAGTQFTSLWIGDISFGNECNEPAKNGGLTHTGVYGPYTSFPNLSTRSDQIIDKSDDPLALGKYANYGFTFNDANSLFPWYGVTNNWFADPTPTYSYADTIEAGKLVINLNWIDQYDSTHLQFSDVTLYNADKSQSISWGSRALFAGGNNNIKVEYFDGTNWVQQTTSPIVAPTETSFNWRITIYNPGAQYLVKNASVVISAEGACGGKTYMHSINYTVDFVTRSGAVHKLYNVHTYTSVKCRNEPGMNIKRTEAYRLNVTKGDRNNDGEDDGGYIGGSPTSDGDTTSYSEKIRLDRAYQNDTLVMIAESYLMGYDVSPSPYSAHGNWDRIYMLISDKNNKISPTTFTHVETKIEVYHHFPYGYDPGPNYTGSIIGYAGTTGEQGFLEPDGSILTSGLPTYQNTPESFSLGGKTIGWVYIFNQTGMPADRKLTANDSIVITTKWQIKPGLQSAEQYTSSLKFWNYAFDGPRETGGTSAVTHPDNWYKAFKYVKADPPTPPNPDLNYAGTVGGYDMISSLPYVGAYPDTEMPVNQMDPMTIFEFDLYTLQITQEGNGYQHLGNNEYFTPYGLGYNQQLRIGARGAMNNSTFLYELRQPYYVDSVKFTIPYGYVLHSPITYFSSGAQGNRDSTYPYQWYFGPDEYQDGLKSWGARLTNKWFTDLSKDYSLAAYDAKDQINDEGWHSGGNIPVLLTPKAPQGLQTIPVTRYYRSPEGLDPYSQTFNIAVYNDAANFLVEYYNTEADAFNDTVRWRIRVENPTSVVSQNAFNCWLYIDGGDNFRPLHVLDKDGNIVSSSYADPNHDPSLGYKGGPTSNGSKWVVVSDNIPGGKAEYYTIVGRYDTMPCDSIHEIHVTPWFHVYADSTAMNHKLAGDPEFYRNDSVWTTAVVGDPQWDMWLGKTDTIYAVHYPSGISSDFTPMFLTPKEPASPYTPTGTPPTYKFGENTVELGTKFPVEALLYSYQIIGVKDVSVDLIFPKGIIYEHGSGYYQWNGDTIAFETAGETKMQSFAGLSDTTITITLKELTGKDSIPGMYNTIWDQRAVYLRFKVSTDCDLFKADSARIGMIVHANRLCGDPAQGDNDTIMGGKIYQKGFRYYDYDQDLYPPAGPDFGFCNGQEQKTLVTRLERLGTGEFQTDTIKLMLPRFFKLDETIHPNNAVRYDQANTSPTDPGATPWEKDGDPIYYYATYNVPWEGDPTDRTKDSTVIKWAVPRKYSMEWLRNLTIAYEIDIVLDTSLPLNEYSYAHTANIFVVSGADSTCSSAATAGRILSRESADLYIHTARVGLAKETSWELDPAKPSDFIVTNTYTIHNYSTGYISNIKLSDDLYDMYLNASGFPEVDMDTTFVITVKGPVNTSGTSDTLAVTSRFMGNGNIISSGMLRGDTTVVVTMQYRATPNINYTGVKYKNNATISAYNQLSCATADTSTWSPDSLTYVRIKNPDKSSAIDSIMIQIKDSLALKTDFSREVDNLYVRSDPQYQESPEPEASQGDREPSNNKIMTPIQFNTFRFYTGDNRQLPFYNILENVGQHTLIVERLGDPRSDVDIAFVGWPDRANSYHLSWLLATDSLAWVGTAADCGVDAWVQHGSMDFTIPHGDFIDYKGSTYARANVVVNIVDDDRYEPAETFYTYLHDARINVSPSTPVALIDDTVSIAIRANDSRPYLEIFAMEDSIKEGTDVVSPGVYGLKPMTFKVKLSNPTYQTVTTDWATLPPTGGYTTATFQQALGSLIFDKNCAAIDPVTLLPLEDTVKFVTVEVWKDSIPETALDAQVKISNWKVDTYVNSSMINNVYTRPNTTTAKTVIVDDDIKIDTLLLRTLICKADSTGAITIEARGGEIRASGGYHFTWTGPGGFGTHHFTPSTTESINNLAAGIYTVTVADVWSQATDTTFTIEVIEPADKLIITRDLVKDVTCYSGSDGAIEITTSGGWNFTPYLPVPPYAYAWTKKDSAYFTATTDDIDSLMHGVYYIMAEDSAGCRAYDTITIWQPYPLEFSKAATVENVICKYDANGTVSIGVKNGNFFKPWENGGKPYLIHWAGSKGYTNINNDSIITGLVADEYIVTVHDNGCETIKDTLTVFEPERELQLYLDSLGRVACVGDATGTVILHAEGGWNKVTPYLYDWTGASPETGLGLDQRNDLPAGNYQVLVSDSTGCDRGIDIPLSFTVVEPAQKLVVSGVAYDETHQNGNDGKIIVTVTGGILNCLTDPAYICGQEPLYHYIWADVAANVKDRYFLEHGQYELSVIDGWDCLVTDTFFIDEPLVIDDLPNIFTPNGDGVNDIFLPNFHIQVHNRYGLLLYEGKDGWDGRYKGELMPPGTYFYILIDETTGKEYKSSVILQGDR